MTENGTWTEEYILASDVWGAEKCIEPLSDEQQRDKWEQAVAAFALSWSNTLSAPLADQRSRRACQNPRSNRGSPNECPE